jgi:hypothetical protein
MTEVEWLAGADWEAMMGYLEGKYLQGEGSDRKLRLFACACSRRLWHLLGDERSRRAVEVAERFADGLASPVDLTDARYGAEDALRDAAGAAYQAAAAAYHTTGDYLPGVAEEAGFDVTETGLLPPEVVCEMLRDLFGNPFRPAKAERGWLSGHDGVVPKVAQAIYDERRFCDLPVLADTLEETGCDNPDVLGHCRGTGEHYRGCWVVDLLLGRS